MNGSFIRGAFGMLVLAAAVVASAQETDMNDQLQIFPLLKTYDWNAKDLAVFQNYGGIDKPPVPLVAFCVNADDNYQIVTSQTAEKNGWTADTLRTQAQKSIDTYPAKWEKIEDFVLTASGQDFSAEKMLCKAFLKDAQKQLGAKQILVAAPRRTVLYAANSEMSDEAREKFNLLLAKTLQDDSYGNQYISPLAFRFEDGEMVGALIIEYEEE